LIIPFINFLYKLKLQRAEQKTKDAFDKPTPIFDSLHKHKSGTPVGGGILIVVLSSILFIFFLFLSVLFNADFHTNYPSVIAEVEVLLFTFISFSFLGIYDDLSKIFLWNKSNFFGLRLRHKLIIEIVLAMLIGSLLFFGLHISFVYIPFFGTFNLSYFYIIFAAFVIVAFSNAVNITDGLDGLSSGVLMIALAAFWVVARDIADVPISLFIAIWLGGLVAFLYFNIFPSRIFLGDAGALSFGATFAVIGLLLGKSFALPIIGGVFTLEVFSSFLQLLSKRFFHRKLFPVAPFHLFLQMRGWEEPKVVMRIWIIGILFAFFGLMIAFMNRP
jgi:phospho-N-acetylmuramoyl-pentapeptide-transferase